jgi:hypothetical protein
MNKGLAEAIANFLGGSPPQQTAPQGPAPGSAVANMTVPEVKSPNLTAEDVAEALPDTQVSPDQQPQPYGDLFWDPMNQFLERMRNGQAPYSHLGENQVRIARDKSANDRSGADTLRYSRLVDRLNNRVYTEPMDIGSEFHGWKGDTGAAMRMPGRYQMPKVQTAESRAQARAETYEDRKNALEQARTDAYKNYDIAMNSLFQNARSQMMQTGYSNEWQRNLAVMQEQIHRMSYQWDDNYRRSYDAFIAQLGLDQQNAKYNELVKIWKSGGSNFAQMFANLISGGVVPNELNAITSSMGMDVWRKMQSGQLPDAAAALAEYYVKYGKAGAQIFQGMLESGIPELVETVNMAKDIVQQQMGGGE